MANVKATMTDIRVIIREFSRWTSLREMERKLKLSRTSLRNYRDRAEGSGRSMVDLLALNDAELQAIMMKGDGHRGRDADRYAFMQERIEDYARDMTRRHRTPSPAEERTRSCPHSPPLRTGKSAAISSAVALYFNWVLMTSNKKQYICKDYILMRIIYG